MPPSESELLALRLARMEHLIEALEEACSHSADQRELFQRLRQEMAATRLALNLPKT